MTDTILPIPFAEAVEQDHEKQGPFLTDVSGRGFHPDAGRQHHDWPDPQMRAGLLYPQRGGMISL